MLRVALLSCVAWASTLCAHPADVSQLRVRVEHDHVEFRFTLNLASIARVVVVDANRDGKITFEEIAAAVPAMRDFLAKSTLVTINNEDATLGEFVKHVCFWPHPETTVITPQDMAQRFVDFNFTKPWPKGVEDVWLGFKVFENLGDLHVIQCIFQQTGEHDTPVEFSAREPDYLYDTGWPAGAAVMSVANAGAAPIAKVDATGWKPLGFLLGGLAALSLLRWRRHNQTV